MFEYLYEIEEMCGCVLSTRHKFKSRLCIKGCAQKYGIDYEDTFAPVIRFSGIRLLLAIEVDNGTELHHVDIKTAYLNGEIDEEINVHQPEGFVMNGKENLVCKLNRAIYGLKQAARQWNTKLDEVLTSMNLTQTPSEPCIYKHNTIHNLMVGVYVDDLIVIGLKGDITNFKSKLAKQLKITDKGPLKFCLNMQVDWSKNRKQVKISQQKFISKLLEKHGMEDCKAKKTPIATGTILEKAEQEEIIKEIFGYQSLVGSFLYLSNCSRPDIAFAVSKLCQHISAPSNQHVMVAKRVLRYLKVTITQGLAYQPGGLECNVFADADFGGDSNDSKSTSGVMIFVGPNLIEWQSVKQSLVALSTCEAEISAIVEGTRNTIYMKGLLDDLQINCNIGPFIIWNDNQSARETVNQGGKFKRNKHYVRRFAFLKDYVKRKKIKIDYCQTERMPADILTKPLTAACHEKLKHICGMTNEDCKGLLDVRTSAK